MPRPGSCRSSILLVGSALLLVACSDVPTQDVLVLDHVTVVDVVGGTVRPDMSVAISGDRIEAVAPAGEYRVPRGAREVDGRGKFVIPGLWDMHVHLDSWDFEHLLPVLVAQGVLSVREMGGDWDKLSSMRQRVERREVVGPRVMLAGEMIDGPTPDWPYRITVHDSSEAHAAVLAHKERGVDFIKVHAQLGRDAYFAIAAAAREADLAFSGHVPDPVTGVEAAASGQHSIEHLTGLPPCETSPSDDSATPADTEADSCPNPEARAAIAAFLEHGTWHDPTLAVYDALLRIDDRSFTHNERRQYLRPVVQDFWDLQMEVNPPVPPKAVRQGWLDGNLANVAALHRAGVPLLTGSDLGFLNTYPGFSLHDELALFVQAGVSPIDALRASTIGPAKFFGSEQEWGSVEAGKVADLVILDGNPLQDISHVRDISAVIVRGRLFDRAALDALLAEAATAAAVARDSVEGQN